MKNLLLICGLLLCNLLALAQDGNGSDSLWQQEHLQLLQTLLVHQTNVSNARHKPTGIQQRLVAQARLTTSDGVNNLTDTSVYKYAGNNRGSKYFASSNGESYSWSFQSDYLNCLYNDMTNKLPDVFADSIISFRNHQPKDTFVAFYNNQNNFDSFFYYRHIFSFIIMRTTHRYNADGKMAELRTATSYDYLNFYDNEIRKFWYNNPNNELSNDTLYTFMGDVTSATRYHYNAENLLDSIVTYRQNNDTFSIYISVNIKYDDQGRVTNIFGWRKSTFNLAVTTYIDSLGYTGDVPDYTYFGSTTIYNGGGSSKSKVLTFLGNNNLPDSVVQLDLDPSTDIYTPYLSRKFYYNSFNNPDSINLIYTDNNLPEHYHFYYETYDDTPEPIGIKDIKEAEVFAIHPNPFNRQLYIDWKAISTAASISLVNGAGQIVFNIKRTLSKGTNTIDLPLLSDGSYMLTIQNEKGKIFSSKLVRK